MRTKSGIIDINHDEVLIDINGDVVYMSISVYGLIRPQETMEYEALLLTVNDDSNRNIHRLNIPMIKQGNSVYFALYNLGYVKSVSLYSPDMVSECAVVVNYQLE